MCCSCANQSVCPNRKKRPLEKPALLPEQAQPSPFCEQTPEPEHEKHSRLSHHSSLTNSTTKSRTRTTQPSPFQHSETEQLCSCHHYFKIFCKSLLSSLPRFWLRTSNEGGFCFLTNFAPGLLNCCFQQLAHSIGCCPLQQRRFYKVLEAVN
jgi:hypothetical protein